MEISICPFSSPSDVRKILEIIIKSFHLDPLQARCYFLDLLKIPGHTFYQIGVNLLTTNFVFFLKSEDTEGQLAAEHHSAQFLPAVQQFFLQNSNLVMVEHIIMSQKTLQTELSNLGCNFAFIGDQEKKREVLKVIGFVNLNKTLTIYYLQLFIF